MKTQPSYLQKDYDWNDQIGFDLRWTGYVRTVLGWELVFHGYINVAGQRHMVFDTAEEIGQLMGGN